MSNKASYSRPTGDTRSGPRLKSGGANLAHWPSGSGLGRRPMGVAPWGLSSGQCPWTVEHLF
jgi:hypothetical protein